MQSFAWRESLFRLVFATLAAKDARRAQRRKMSKITSKTSV